MSRIVGTQLIGPAVSAAGLLGSGIGAGGGAAAAGAAAGAGAATAGAAAAAAPAASVGPVGIILVMAMLAYSIATRPNGKDRRSPGSSFYLRENPTDPNEPMGLGYGMLTIVPPILCRYLKRSGLNSLAYQSGADDSFVAVLSLGGGPIDGRDLQVWLNDEPLFEATETGAPDDEANLEQVDAAGKRWRFPKRYVAVDSVALYRDGTLIGANDQGGGITDTVEQTFTAVRIEPRLFVGDEPYRVFPAQTGDRRYGSYTPLDVATHTVRDLSVDLVPKAAGRVRLSPELTGSVVTKGFFGSTVTVTGAQASLISSRQTLPSSHVHLAVTRDGRSFFWVGVDTTGLYSGDNIDKFFVSFRAKPTIRIVVEPDGQAYAEFQTAQTGTISATYKTSRITDGNGRSLVELVLRTGEPDQEPLPIEDGIRNTAHVGAELGQGDSSVYESVNEVHDVEVGIASGPEGFVDVDTSSGATRTATRKLQIRLRRRGAPDEDATGTDLDSGWVALKHPQRQDVTLPVTGQVDGPARWVFSAAELYAFTRDGKVGAGFSLPLARYDVEVTALDVPGNRNDNREHASIQSRIFFDNATEIVRIRLSLPYHATLTVKVKDAKLLAEEPVFAVRCGMRRVVVPAESAEVLDLGDGYRPWERVGGVLIPSPRRWTRNNVWCAADIVTDPWFGAGQWFDWRAVSLADEAGAHEGAAWCDSTEPGEVMAELDLWLNRRSAVLDNVAQMFAGARIFPALTGGTWEFPIDRDGDPVMELTDADLESGVSRSHVAIEETPTEIEASFLDEQLGGELAPHTVSLPSQDPRRRVLRRVDMAGVRRRSQLDRVLRVHLEQFQRQKDSADALGANWRFLPLRAGRIVRVTSDEAGWTAQLARVMAVSWGSNLKAAVRVVVHDPASYVAGQFRGPNGGVVSGSRPPSDATTSGSASAGGTTSAVVAEVTSAKIEVAFQKLIASFKAARVSTSGA